MVRSIRTPLILAVAALLPAGATLHAQRAEAGAVRRTPRAEPADSNERQLRRLERAAVTPMAANSTKNALAWSDAW